MSSDPASRRAMWGIISPTKAIGPTAAVAPPHSSVIANRPSSWVRIIPVPSAAASSLPILKLFNALLSHRVINVPSRIGNATLRTTAIF
ncbi:hypothetical protein D3C78_1674560 [compost metagenome]